MDSAHLVALKGCVSERYPSFFSFEQKSAFNYLLFTGIDDIFVTVASLHCLQVTWGSWKPNWPYIVYTLDRLAILYIHIHIQ